MEWGNRVENTKISKKINSKWRIIATYLILASIIIFSYSVFSTDLVYGENGREYLLSSVSQCLAATFALVFTISLIAIQLRAKYSPRMLKQFFSFPIIIFMIFFICSIIFPLLILIYLSDIGVKISIILTFACLFLLIPYFYSFKDTLSPDYLVKNLKNEIKKEIKLAQSPPFIDKKYPIALFSLDNLIMSAYSDKDYATFQEGLETLGEIAVDIANYKNKTKKEEYNILKNSTEDLILRRITNISKMTIDDPSSAIIGLNIFKVLVMKAIENEIEPMANHILYHLNEVGIEAIRKNHEYENLEIVDILFDIGIKAIEKKHENITQIVISSLGLLGSKSAENKLDNVVLQAGDMLLGICIETIKNKLEKSMNDAVDRLGFLGVRLVEEELDYGTERIIHMLGSIGSHAVDNKLGELAIRVVSKFEEIGIKSSENHFENGCKKILHELEVFIYELENNKMSNDTNEAFITLWKLSPYFKKYLPNINEDVIKLLKKAKEKIGMERVNECYEVAISSFKEDSKMLSLLQDVKLLWNKEIKDRKLSKKRA